MSNAKTPFRRIVSISAAAMCLIASLKIAPVEINISAADVMTPFEITQNIKIGWNVGNSLDSTSSNSDPTPNQSETAWGNPATTQEMINTVKAKGFNAIRVPTTWFQHLDGNNNIDTDYLDRVQEVVDYAYKQGMYVILNVHHENWVNRSDLGTAYNEMSVKLKAIWKQIATRFADYDQHLIFEGMNEPRAAGTTHEWWGPTKDEVDTINKLDQDFVDTVRSVSSPYQKTRLLMVPPYCATSDQSMYSQLVVPKDDYICVSLHAYSPYSFVMDKEGSHDTFTASMASELKNILTSMRDTYLDNDIPVIIGEFSSSNYNNTEARCEWANVYLTTAKEYGLPCFLWDNNVDVNPSDPSEAHGYLNRSNNTWYSASEPVIDAMMKVLNDDSVVWGSKRKAPVYNHPSLDSGKVVSSKSETMNGTNDDDNDNCTSAFPCTLSDIAGKDIAVKFTGDTPVLAFMDSEWGNWTEFKPYHVDTANGIAYFSDEDIKSGWTASSAPASAIFRTNGITTVTKVAVIGKPTVTEAVVTTAATSKTQSTTTTTASTTKKSDSATSTATTSKPAESTATTKTDKTDSNSVKYSFDDLKETKDGWVIPLDSEKQLVKYVVELESSCDKSVSWYCGGGALTSSNIVPAAGGAAKWGNKPFQYNAGDKSVTVEIDGEFVDADEESFEGKITGKEAIFQDWWTAASDETATVSVTYKSITLYYADAPAVSSTTASTAKTTTSATATTTASSQTTSGKIVYGDANCDGKVALADAVAILQYLANSSKYPLTDEGKANADVDGEGGITANDALVLQKYDAGSVTTLPVKK